MGFVGFLKEAVVLPLGDLFKKVLETTLAFGKFEGGEGFFYEERS